MYISSSNIHNGTYENISWNSVSDRCNKMFRINTDSWKLQVLIKHMDSEIFLSVQNFSNIYIYSRESDIVPFILTSYELSIFYQDETNFCTHSSQITCVCRGGVEVAGLTVDQEIRIRFLALPSPLVGSLLARRLKTSSDVPVPCRGRLGKLKTPICPWRWVPGSRSKFKNWTTCPVTRMAEI